MLKHKPFRVVHLARLEPLSRYLRLVSPAGASCGAYSRRVAIGDVESLAHMISLADDINDGIAQAVSGLRDAGYSWAEIGSRLGITRQAAQQR
jgi:hypothetical protein